MPIKIYVDYSNDDAIESGPLKDLYEKINFYHLEMVKYKGLWALRSIENEITEEGGVIILKSTGVETRNFTPDLTEKILFLLNEGLNGKN